MGGSGGGNNPTKPRPGNFTLVSSMREFVLPTDVKGLGQFAASQLKYVAKKLDGFTSADSADSKKTEFRRLTSALARLQPIYDAAAKALEEEESSDEGVELQNALDYLRNCGENERLSKATQHLRPRTKLMSSPRTSPSTSGPGSRRR